MDAGWWTFAQSFSGNSSEKGFLILVGSLFHLAHSYISFPISDSTWVAVDNFLTFANWNILIVSLAICLFWRPTDQIIQH